MSDVVFGVSGKSCQFRFCGNYMNGVRCLLIAYCIYVGAYGIRPAHHRVKRSGKPPSRIAKPAQFRAYAIRPYGGANR
mgnify:CR=1 FL=1